jgi:hypothetical protein
LERGYIKVTRNPISIGFLVTLAFMNTFLWASIYYNVDKQQYSLTGGSENKTITWNLMGLCFLMVQDMFINMCMGQVVAIPQTFPVFKREVSNGMFTPTVFYLAESTVQLMTFFWYPFLLTLCSIWFFGLPYMSFKGFCEWWGILTLVCFCGSSFGFMMGCLFPSFNFAQIVAQNVIIIFALGAGFYTNSGSGAHWLNVFVSDISPLFYGCEMMLKRLLAGKNEHIQHELLSFFGYTQSNALCCFVLILFFCGFNLIGWFALCRQAKQ